MQGVLRFLRRSLQSVRVDQQIAVECPGQTTTFFTTGFSYVWLSSENYCSQQISLEWKEVFALALFSFI